MKGINDCYLCIILTLSIGPTFYRYHVTAHGGSQLVVLFTCQNDMSKYKQYF